MTEFVYCVYDRKADLYNAPMFFVNDDVCKRSVMMALAGSDSPLARFPEDYQIVCIGRFNSDAGSLIPFDHTVVCDSLLDLVIKKGVSCEGATPPESMPPETLAE